VLNDGETQGGGGLSPTVDRITLCWLCTQVNINEKAIGTILVTVKTIVAVLGTVVIVIGAGVLFVEITKPTAEEAVQQAKEYQSEGFCGAAITPAVHKDTGATYTCSNTCLAPGWEPAR
jgi:hypothetical protein